jgi:hypothetical protein
MQYKSNSSGRSHAARSISATQLLWCQYLYFCTSKASKLRAAQVCQYLYFCTSKTSKLSALSRLAPKFQVVIKKKVEYPGRLATKKKKEYLGKACHRDSRWSPAHLRSAPHSLPPPPPLLPLLALLRAPRPRQAFQHVALQIANSPRLSVAPAETIYCGSTVQGNRVRQRSSTRIYLRCQ